MMSKYYLILFFLIAFDNSNSRAQVNEVWERHCTNSPGRIISDRNDAVYIAAEDSTVKLCKYAPNGDLLWIKTVVDSGGIFWLDIDSSGNPIITSYLYGCSFDYHEITKCDSSGTKLWNIIIPDTVSSIWDPSVDKYGSIYFMGNGGLTGGVNLWKYDSSGTFVYKINRPFTGGSYGAPAIFDSFNTSYFRYNPQIGSIYYTYILKIDSVGNIIDSLITNDYFGSNYCLDANENLICCVDTLISGSYRSFIKKYDNNFNFLWSFSFNEDVGGLVVDHSGNIYSMHPFDGNQQYPFNRIVVYKLDSSGNQLWAHPFNLLGNIPQHTISAFHLDSGDYPIIVGNKYDNGYVGTNLTDKFYIEKLNYNGMMLSYEEKIISPNPILTGVGSSNVNFTDNIYLLTLNSSPEVFKYCSNCINTLSGTVYFDADSNCVQGGLEQGIPNAIIEINPGPTYTNTDSSGFYHLFLADSAYDAFCNPYSNYSNTCPVAAVPFTVSNSIPVSNTNFGLNVPNSIHDLLVNIAHGPVRRGFDILFVINYQNIGGDFANGNVDFVYDSIFSFIQSNIPPSLIIADTLRWNFFNLNPGESRSISVILHLPASTPFGTNYTNYAFIKGIFNDDHPDNNTDVDSGTVVGSYDPNDKNVTPKGIGSQGYITTNDSVLLYKINFENTGNDTAFDAMVIDTISQHLDMTSIRAGASSHNYILQVEKSNILKFIFNNINLPDSASNPNENYGFINYYIKQKHSLPAGTQITNSADIYFDANLPLKTNATLNTITNLTAIKSNTFLSGEVQISPNPTSGKFTILSPSEKISQITITSLSGQTILKKDIKNNFNSSIEIDLTNQSKGIYLIQVITDKEVYNQKIILD